MPNLACDIENLVFWAPDSRADGGVRRVRLTRDVIRIERKVAGMRMGLEVPLAAYSGVTLVREQRLRRNFYCITLAHRDPDLSVTLHRAAATPMLVDLWQNWARFFLKPALYAENENTDFFRKSGQNARRLRPRPLAERRLTIFARLTGLECAPKIVRPTRELFSRE